MNTLGSSAIRAICYSALLLALGELKALSDTLDGSTWLDSDTDYRDRSAYSIPDNPLNIVELSPSRLHYATRRLGEAKWVEIDKGHLASALDDTDVPNGRRPFLVRAIFKYSAGSRFDAWMDGTILHVRHICIQVIEPNVYKSPIIVFLDEEPSDVVVHHYTMGW